MDQKKARGGGIKKAQVHRGFEPRLEESEPSVITNYTNGPLLHALFHVTI